MPRKFRTTFVYSMRHPRAWKCLPSNSLSLQVLFLGGRSNVVTPVLDSVFKPEI